MGSKNEETARNPEAQELIGPSLNGDPNEKDRIWGNDRMWGATGCDTLFAHEPICPLSDERATDVLSYVCDDGIP